MARMQRIENKKLEMIERTQNSLVL